MKRLALLLVATASLVAGPGCGSDKSSSSDTTAAPKAAADPIKSDAPPVEPSKPADYTPPDPGDAHDFINEAQFLFRVAACAQTDAAIPAHLSANKVDAACKRQRQALELYKSKWLAKAGPFFAELVPEGLPGQVVYPFGGGDLMTGMAVFPDFDELTTLSLEPAGDPRAVMSMPPRFNKALAVIHKELRRLYRINHSLTKEMTSSFRGGTLPGHLIFSLAALDIHGMAPTAVYYFELEPDGSIDYMTTAEAEKREARGKKSRNSRFGNVEIRFSKPGDDRVRIYRHLMANLDNEHIEADPRALKHLEAKGKVPMMTKAASFLLWWDNFSTIRTYIIDHAMWMVSDATGIPPRHAEAAGFAQETYGKFTAPILNPGQVISRQFRQLWKENPQKPLAFRFGYPDKRGLNHLMVTHPAAR
jgi:hypothetical protein